MKCSRCGIESNGYAINGSCSLCGVSVIAGGLSAETRGEIVPWETKQAGETPLESLFATFRNSFFSGNRFFSAVGNNPALIPALIYGMALGSAGTCAAALWNLFPSLSLNMLFPDSAIFNDFAGAISPGSLIASPLVLLAQLFLSSAYVHCMLIITGSRKKSFRFTFKTMCYAGGSMVFQAVPLIGAVLGICAWTFLTVMGIRSVHGISIKRALMVLLLPFLILTVASVIIGTMLVLVAAILSGMQIDPVSLFR